MKMTYSLRYGLKKCDFYQMINILKSFKTIKSVVLFGSRARGDHKPTSDVDLAIVFKENLDQLYKVTDTLANANIIYTFDVVDYDKITNENLKNEIDQEGKTIYLTNSTGKVIHTMNKINYKLTDLEKALDKLHESSSRDASKDDIVIDATIQRFEFTYELSWKLMKIYLEYNGNLEANSPRRVIKESFKEGMIVKGDEWIKMLEDRNRTSHTYDEQTANEIFLAIKKDYISLFDEFVKRMKELLA